MNIVTLRHLNGSEEVIRDSKIRSWYRRIMRFLWTGALSAVFMALALTASAQSFITPGSSDFSSSKSKTFVFTSTSAFADGAAHLCLINRSSTATIRLMSVDIVNASSVVVTGLVGRFNFVPVTALTIGGRTQVSTFSMVTSNNGYLNAQIEASTGATGLTVEGNGVAGYSFDNSCFIQGDETPTIGGMDHCNLYRYHGNGAQAYTALAGSARGWCVIQNGAASNAGVLGTRMEFVQD